MRIIERILVLQRMHPRYSLGWLTSAAISDPQPSDASVPRSTIKVKAQPSLGTCGRTFAAEEILYVGVDKDIDESILRIQAALSGKAFTCPIGKLDWCHLVNVEVQREAGVVTQSILTWSGQASYRTELPL